MKAHTSRFKEEIKSLGKEIDSKITFGDIVLGKNDLNAITPSFQSSMLKSVMKQLDIDSNVEIPIGTILKYEFGIKTDNEYEYINFGNYIVYSTEKQEDTNSYKITCYDKILYSMIDYRSMPITFPISVKEYIKSICDFLGLKFANENDEFVNHSQIIPNELYLSENGQSLGFTFRDVLDELAEVTASIICLNENDELEIRYVNETNDTIDEEFLKDINVNFGEKFGPVNSIVLSRSAESDNIYLQDAESIETNGLCEIKIKDNQIMNFNNRADFLPGILEKLNGLEFYVNDYVSTGICYYDLFDKYNVKIGNTVYHCIMFNDEVLITQGLQENVFTELPEENETDYKKSDTTDQRINQAFIIVDKQNQTIESLTKEVEETEETIIKQVQTLQTTVDAQIKIIENIQSNINESGEPTSVTTTTGFTFNADGLHIEKSGEPTKSTVDEAGIEVQDANTGTNEVQFYAGYVNDDVVADESELEDYRGQSVTYTKNVIFKKYLATTNGRMENVHHDKYGDGIGFFV